MSEVRASAERSTEWIEAPDVSTQRKEIEIEEMAAIAHPQIIRSLVRLTIFCQCTFARDAERSYSLKIRAEYVNERRR